MQVWLGRTVPLSMPLRAIYMRMRPCPAAPRPRLCAMGRALHAFLGVCVCVLLETRHNTSYGGGRARGRHLASDRLT